ncbi:MAG TPA: hypothetical protein VL995_00840 [Cellvibrio sp.]|nr:hypothetical protein [Cellvibrio sp.]
MRKLIAALSIFVLAGCSTLKDAQDAKGTGVQQTYNKPYDVVWAKTVEVVQESKLELVAKDKEGGSILAQKSMSAFSYGENVAVYVEKKSDSVTVVEVVSKRALATNITARNWSSYIHEELGKKLK